MPHASSLPPSAGAVSVCLPAEPAFRGHDMQRAIVAAAAGMAIAVVTLMLVMTARDLFPDGSIFVMFGVLTSVSVVCLGWSRTERGDRTAAVMSLTTFGWVPTILVALVLWQEPTLYVSGPQRRDLVSDLLENDLARMPWIALFFLVASTLLALHVHRSRPDRTLRAFSALALVVVALATGLALAHLARPDAARYVLSVPVVRTFVPGDSLAVPGEGTLTYNAMAERPACILSGEGRAFAEIDGCDPLTLRRDDKNGIWIWERPYATELLINERELTGNLSSRSWIFDMGDTPWYAFKPRSRKVGDVYAVDLAGSITAPAPSTAGAIVGLALGAVLFVAALQAARRGTSLVATEATLERGDWAVIPGHPPRQLPGASALPPGPILVRLHAVSASMAYRDQGPVEIEVIGTGTLEQLRAQLSGRAGCLYACALTCTLLPAVPLLAFLVVTGGR